uniref:Tyrosine-protein phosphatase domain-containing protein n=1 Tax=Caenorhabditis tropicalis TaxID=1561998 RepID=A0A1I7TF48_9PELO
MMPSLEKSQILQPVELAERLMNNQCEPAEIFINKRPFWLTRHPSDVTPKVRIQLHRPLKQMYLGNRASILPKWRRTEAFGDPQRDTWSSLANIDKHIGVGEDPKKEKELARICANTFHATLMFKADKQDQKKVEIPPRDGKKDTARRAPRKDPVLKSSIDDSARVKKPAIKVLVNDDQPVKLYNRIKEKKSPNTKTNNNKRRELETRVSEEKTAIHAAKSKVVQAPVKKSASKGTVAVERAKSSTDLKLVRKTQSTVTTTTQDKTEKSKEKKKKWSGEEAAGKFLKAIESLNVKEEYEEIGKMTVQTERCKIWSAHSSRNRHPDYKCYDDNRVIVQMCKSDYINGTKVNVPNFSPLVYLMQLPKLETPDAIEEFWRVVFHEQCQSVHIIAQPEELPGIEKLFGQRAGDYLYANGFFVNTRKVEKTCNWAELYVVELLPEGCSNSVMCSVYLHTMWKQFNGPTRFSFCLKAAQQIAKGDQGSSPTVIASVNGAGRNASLLTMAVIVDQLSKGKEPKIFDIVRTIREQRPQSVDSFVQYFSLFYTTNHLIKSKVQGNDEVAKRLSCFYAKAANKLPNSTMKQPTEGD